MTVLPNDTTQPLPPEPVTDKQSCRSLPNRKCNKLFYCLAAFLILVILSGVAYFYSIRNQPPIPPTTTKNKVTPIPSPDPTIDWKTYNNKKYQYSIKYSEWFFDPVETSVNSLVSKVKFSPTAKYFEFEILSTSDGSNYKFDINEFIPKGWVIDSTPNLETISIDGQDVNKTTYEPGLLFSVGPIIKDRFSYYVVYLGGQINSGITNGDFDQILSTFEFLE